MTSAKVILYGKTMGYLVWDDRQRTAIFEYDKDFVQGGLEPSPLLMPARQNVRYSFPELRGETFKGLPGLFADSLPDRYGRELMKSYLSLVGKKEENAIESLCFLGSRCMGAMEFEPAYKRDTALNTNFEIGSLVEIAQAAVSQKEKFVTNIKDDKKKAVADILSLSTSAGGQRAKAVIAYNKETGEVRSGQLDAPAGFEQYLIKLDGVSAGEGFSATQNFGRAEWSFALLAKKCGIEMTDCDIIEENGRAHFITKRFDRTKEGKVHMQTLCGIAHYDYNMLRVYSYEQAFGVMRSLNLKYPEMQEMFRRMVFNVVVRNQDDHTKNISFLMDKNGEWRLSPAYDMGYNYNPNGDWASQHQMSINGKFDGITKADLMAFAKNNDIQKADEIIGQVVEVCSEWPMLAKECGLPQTFIDERYPFFQIGNRRKRDGSLIRFDTTTQ